MLFKILHILGAAYFHTFLRRRDYAVLTRAFRGISKAMEKVEKKLARRAVRARANEPDSSEVSVHPAQESDPPTRHCFFRNARRCYTYQ